MLEQLPVHSTTVVANNLNSPSTRGLKLPKGGRLKMAPLRSRESVDLDTAQHAGADLPPFVPWARFRETFDFRQGEHVTLVGTTGSGKTTLARELLLPMREYVCVLGTKTKDPSLYAPLERAGYDLEHTFDANAQEHGKRRIIFQPPLRTPDRDGFNEQSEAFKTALFDIYKWGGWCVYADEVRYLTETLGLQRTFEVLWLQGRSLGISLVVGTQRPVSIPLLAFDQATHLFLWRNTDRVNIERMSEFAGADSPIAKYTIPRLPHHEALYIDTRTGRMVRTKVELPKERR